MELQFISVLAEAKPSLHALSALYCVGGDAHIAPAEQSVFTGIFGEFDRALGSMWASTPTNFYEVDPNFAHKNGLRILPDKGHTHTAGAASSAGKLRAWHFERLDAAVVQDPVRDIIAVVDQHHAGADAEGVGPVAPLLARSSDRAFAPAADKLHRIQMQIVL